ncbi:Zinc finger protein aebp2 [Clonorchis sinensis]|uniref:Zinc finger protein aebp2 n=1 Tax=Clonorchis sinensis TaxID=79923 RepID=A0A419Q9G1_CLOSI|nr:Zinc finger protein aebp2 [Clonorchis sinensis]
MTYSARTQRKPALSVRTRALIHKYHERIISQRVMGWNSCEMRLRARLNNCAPWEVTTRTSSVEDGFSKVNSDDVTSDEIPSGSVPSEIAALGGESRAPVSQTGSSACSTASTESGSIVQCKWDGCGSSLEQSQLVTHIQHVHVLPQMISNRRKCFACLWRDCRVYRRPSVSAAWLESHILHHTDAKGKPFRCIFDGCTLRFSTSILLERHVQRAHMRVTRTQTGSLPAQLTNTLSSVNESPKLITTTAGQSSNGALGQITASPTPNGKRSSRRRRKVRNYRVRRPDFYDRRSHCVIQNRLKLGHLLGSSDHTVGLRSDDHFQHRRLPKPLVGFPSKPRLRSATGCPPTSLEKSTPSPSSELRRNRLAMLLTMPHTYVGQRLSDNNQLEVLVRWTSDCSSNQPLSTWVPDEELQAAGLLGSML